MPEGSVATVPRAARLLDLTRLVSRVGHGPWTGVDRVEAAYLDQFLADPLPLFSLIRTSLGFVLLDRTGTEALAARLTGHIAWGPADLTSHLSRRAPALRRRAESDLRRLARARCRPGRLGKMLRAHLPAETTWVNVGHTNLSESVFDAVHALPGGRAATLVHDLIPLDHPELQRPGTVPRFEARMRAVAGHADLVICNSEVTREDCARHFGEFGRVPEMITAPLGVAVPKPDRAAMPQIAGLTDPYFIILGTIEPRKNHALLIEVWEDFAKTLPMDDIPTLVIAGARGWNNDTVFDWLDKAPLSGRKVLEISGLTDGAVAHLIERARALLMPSLAEGFGLPPMEATALGTPVIANPLPVYWEILGNNPIYAPVDDMYSWSTRILELAGTKKTTQQATDRGEISLPTWQAHFNLVLKVV